MLMTLPEAQRIAVTLMDVCGFTAHQVADITGVPRGTVLARVHRGRKRLALSLASDGTAPLSRDGGA
jgi:RNA polymerase sigma-70 factor, ECF subfamily